jgi:hypothetical protein
LLFSILKKGKILQVIDGRFSLIESEAGGSFMTVNNFHLQPIFSSTEKDRFSNRKKVVTSSTTADKVGSNRPDNSVNLPNKNVMTKGNKRKSPPATNFTEISTNSNATTNKQQHDDTIGIRSPPTKNLHEIENETTSS